MKHFLSTQIATALLVAGLSAYAAEPVTIQLDTAAKGHAIPKTLYGIFYEDISYASDGGMYPELIENRGFDWTTGDLEGWAKDFRGDAMARLTRQNGNPVHANTATYLRIECFGPGEGCGVRNDGFFGIAVEAGKKYDLSFYARGLEGYKGNIKFLLEAENGELLASYTLENAQMNVSKVSDGMDFILPDFKKHTAVLTPKATHKNAHLSVLMDQAGIAELDLISLYPQDTYNGRKNGLRKDLMQLLKEMKPAVVRFPGGCVTEGQDFATWFDWRRTVGPLERRTTIPNSWGYWQTMGLGYFEFFQMCEDLGAEPMPILGAGLTCQFSKLCSVAPMSSMDYFAQVFLDLIEFANGDVTTKWGKVRADMGHPKPFNLKFVGIGNENWDMVFLERFTAIQKIVNAKHPEIRLISSSGPYRDGGSYDLAWNYLSKKETKADLIDEHYYVPPEWLLANTTRYDKFDRNGPKVYAGEYACHMANRENSLYSALCEAAMMTGFERNSDVVEMATYAPLFCNVNHVSWQPDLIWFDNTRAFGTPNYYVQKMFSTNLPDTLVPSKVQVAPAKAAQTGSIGIQTWNTTAEFADIKVVSNADGKVLYSGLPDLNTAIKHGGKWSIQGNVIRQTQVDVTDTVLNFGPRDLGNCTITMRVRKISGSEGFIVRLLDNLSGNWAHINLGGWGNAEHGVETWNNDGVSRRGGKIETNRWYDLKIKLDGTIVNVWLDKEQIFTNVDVSSQSPDFFTVSGYDAKAEEIVVKCVNVADTERNLTVNFGDVKLAAGTAKRITLTGAANAKNSLDNPTACSPVEDTVSVKAGSVFTGKLSPYSMTVYRFKR